MIKALSPADAFDPAWCGALAQFWLTSQAPGACAAGLLFKVTVPPGSGSVCPAGASPAPAPVPVPSPAPDLSPSPSPAIGSGPSVSNTPFQDLNPFHSIAAGNMRRLLTLRSKHRASLLWSQSDCPYAPLGLEHSGAIRC